MLAFLILFEDKSMFDRREVAVDKAGSEGDSIKDQFCPLACFLNNEVLLYRK